MPAPDVRSAFSINSAGKLAEKNYAPYMRDGEPTCAVLDADARVMKKSDYKNANRKFNMLRSGTQEIYSDAIRDEKDKRRKGLYEKMSQSERTAYEKDLKEVGLTHGRTDANAIADSQHNGGHKGRESVWNVGGRPVVDSLMGSIGVVSFNEGGNIFEAERMEGAYKEGGDRGASMLARTAGISPEVAAAAMTSPAAQKFRASQIKNGM